MLKKVRPRNKADPPSLIDIGHVLTNRGPISVVSMTPVLKEAMMYPTYMVGRPFVKM